MCGKEKLNFFFNCKRALLIFWGQWEGGIILGENI